MELLPQARDQQLEYESQAAPIVRELLAKCQIHAMHLLRFRTQSLR